MSCLTGFLPVWDVERRRADVSPLVDWTLRTLREDGVEAPSLERLHDSLPPAEALRASRQLTKATSRSAPRRALHAVLRALLPELPWRELAIQATAHVRVLVPGDTTSPVPLHTDHGIGHALDERNVWIALTSARDTAALSVATLAASRPAEEERRAGGRVLVDPRAPSEPRPCARGDALLFTPLHVHGARVVAEDATRVSIDVRVAPRLGALARNRFAWVPCREVLA